MFRRFNKPRYILILTLLLFSLMISSCSKEKNDKLRDFNDGVTIPIGEIKKKKKSILII